MIRRKLIPCYCWTPDGVIKMQRPVKEIVSERNTLRETAFNWLKLEADNPRAKHFLYYMDSRNDRDEIEVVHFFYVMTPMDDDDFYRITKYMDGFVGAVHRHS